MRTAVPGSLLSSLRTSGHDVERVVDVPALDSVPPTTRSFTTLCADDGVLITKNGADFIDLATRPGAVNHPGILVIRYQDDGTALPVATIVRAVANIAKTYETTTALFLDVNHHVVDRFTRNIWRNPYRLGLRLRRRIVVVACASA